MRDFKKYVLWDRVTPVAITSSTDATPIVVTATAHGFNTDDLVMIYGHTTNVAANGTYRVIRLTANTFSLKDMNTGASIAGSGGGAGSGGTVVIAPKMPIVEDFRNIILQVFTSGTATATIQVAGSISEAGSAMPNFGASVSATNFYSFLQAIDLDTGSAVNGATGFVATAADIQKSYEININAEKFITVILKSWTQGVITVKCMLADNE